MSAAEVLRAGLPAVMRPIARLQAWLRPGIRVLMYHRVLPAEQFDQLTVSPARFAQHMSLLAERCEVISLDEAVRRLRSGSVRQPGGKPPVVITFDDGYRDNLVHALPVLQRLRLPATIFVTTGFCDQQLRHPRYPQEQGQMHLDWTEVRQLASTPGITIGSHTLTHPYLQRLPQAQAWQEVQASRDRIARELGRAVDYFCYPSGDATEREAKLVEQAGYQAAVTVAPGLNRPGQRLPMLHRTEVTDRDTPRDLALKLDGAFDAIHAVLHWRRQRRFAQAARGAAQSVEEGTA